MNRIFPLTILALLLSISAFADDAIKIVSPTNCKVTLIFYGDKYAGGNILLDGTKIAINANGEYAFTAAGGTTYELKKGDTMNLFLVLFEPLPATKKGDVNLDGEVNIQDVTALVNIILGKSEKNAQSDVNEDTEVNIQDVTALVNIILGK